MPLFMLIVRYCIVFCYNNEIFDVFKLICFALADDEFVELFFLYTIIFVFNLFLVCICLKVHRRPEQQFWVGLNMRIWCTHPSACSARV